MEEEYEKFEITDYDLQNEFNRKGRRLTKKQTIYGVFAESDDSDEEVELKTKRGGKAGTSSKNYSSNIDFISGGIQQSGKKKDEVQKDEEDQNVEEESHHRGFGFASKKDSSDDSEEDVRPTFKPAETAGMRAGAKSSEGNVKDWEKKSSYGIGAKILLQMGFKPGMGLGKDLQGIAAPIEAHVRKGRGAIGAYGPEKKTKVGELKGVVKKDEKKEAKTESRGRQWSKKGHKSRYFYKSVEDVIEKGKKPDFIFYDNNNKLSKVTVIDMTGPEKRVLSGYHVLNQMKITDDDQSHDREFKHFQLPELMHNLNIMVNLCEQDIIANDKRQRIADDRQKSLQAEKDQLEKIVQLEKKYIETMEDVEELVERLTSTENSPTLEEAEKIFIDLKVSFPNEFKEFSLGDLAPGIIAPLITACMREWNPLEQPTKHVTLIKRWSELLDYSKTTSTTVFEPYPALVWSTVIPCFRRAAADWNPMNHTQMAALLDAWSALLPEWMLDNVLDQIVLSKLTQAVAEWDPLTDIVPIHTWIIPWSNILGSKMHGNVYKSICNKLSKALLAWHPSDRSALAMIKPWKGVFMDEELSIFLYKNVVPKLEYRMGEIIFNPLQQNLEIFNQVYEWHELLSPLVMSSILDKYFFPKWMQTLVLWLNQSPNFDEVSRWYTGWKRLMSEAVLKQPNVNEHFRRALELMQRATGMPISMPEPVILTPAISESNFLSQSNHSLDYKEIVSQKCAERGIIFAPMPGRRENGKQVYRIGKLFCYFEKSVCCVSSDPGNSQAYMPMSLSVILEKSK